VGLLSSMHILSSDIELSVFQQDTTIQGQRHGRQHDAIAVNLRFDAASDVDICPDADPGRAEDSLILKRRPRENGLRVKTDPNLGCQVNLRVTEVGKDLTVLLGFSPTLDVGYLALFNRQRNVFA